MMVPALVIVPAPRNSIPPSPDSVPPARLLTVPVAWKSAAKPPGARMTPLLVRLPVPLAMVPVLTVPKLTP
jgi:hypothetical protein